MPSDVALCLIRKKRDWLDDLLDDVCNNRATVKMDYLADAISITRQGNTTSIPRRGIVDVSSMYCIGGPTSIHDKLESLSAICQLEKLRLKLIVGHIGSGFSVGIEVYNTNNGRETRWEGQCVDEVIGNCYQDVKNGKF